MSDLPLVLHVVYSLQAGGMENGLVNLINRMPEGSYAHGVICLTKSGEFARRITKGNVKIYEINKRPGHDFSAYWRFWRLLRTLQPAILHTRNLSALEMHLVAVLVPGIKRIHGEHGRDIYDLDGNNRKYNLLRRFMRRFVQHYICVSVDLEKWLKQTIGVSEERVTQIYNGVDESQFDRSLACGSFIADFPDAWKQPGLVICGSVGRLAEVKNQASMFRAMAILRDESPEVFSKIRLILVGDGPLKEELKQLQTELGLNDCTWIAGGRDNVSQFLDCMDFFILPSLGEGISNTILEAMSMSLPVIATAVGGNVELIEDGINGRLVAVSDDRSLSIAMVELAENKGIREKMGQAGRQLVDTRFKWFSAVSNYMAVYDRMLQKTV